MGLLTAGAMLLVAAGVAVAATVTCTGGLCEGTKNPDQITGSPLDDYIVAKAGADAVDAGAGDDVVEGPQWPVGRQRRS